MRSYDGISRPRFLPYPLNISRYQWGIHQWTHSKVPWNTTKAIVPIGFGRRSVMVTWFGFVCCACEKKLFFTKCIGFSDWKINSDQAYTAVRDTVVSRQSYVSNWGHPLKISDHHSTIVLRGFNRVPIMPRDASLSDAIHLKYTYFAVWFGRGKLANARGQVSPLSRQWQS